jgi:deoxyxylulose-5-phosphate synthase
MEQHQFDGPQVIKLIGRQGIPYSVAEWQQDKWHNQFLEIRQGFLEKAQK